jgi:hypothetical protein
MAHIKRDHRKVDSLFQELSKSGLSADRKRSIADSIIKELSVHSSVEGVGATTFACICFALTTLALKRTCLPGLRARRLPHNGRSPLQ